VARSSKLSSGPAEIAGCRISRRSSARGFSRRRKGGMPKSGGHNFLPRRSMHNKDIMDLYGRVNVGTRVVFVK
jgi:hypothetical protein